MKKLLLLAVILILPVIVMAKQRDVLYLKNGSVVRGTIIETKENGSVTIRTDNGKEYQYTQFDIREITVERGRGDETKTQRTYVAFQDKKKRVYTFAAELSGYATLESGGKTFFPSQFAILNGLRFSEFLSISAGVGVRYYERSSSFRTNDNSWAFPFFADVRGNFVSHKGRNLVPYWSLDAGYSVNDDNFFFSPTIGVSIGGYRNNILVGVSYMGQWMDRPVVPGIDQKKTYILDAIGIKLGFQF